MLKRITLPKIQTIQLNGFRPIFSDKITASLNDGPFIVLGGNGLGKTTLIQAVIYGLAGGLEDSIEEIKGLRWDHGYFRSRLDPNQLSEAFVEIGFSFGEENLIVRRGFKGSSILAFKVNDSEWVTDDATSEFENGLSRYGGYKSVDDFAFLVHRLLYLPESRRLIAWDTDAQIRLLMMLNQDVVKEDEFRQNRVTLRNLDSSKRHIHVAIGHVDTEIEKLEVTNQKGSKKRSIETEEEEDSEGDILADLVEELTKFRKNLAVVEKREREARHELSLVSSQVELERESLENAEAGLVQNFLNEAEANRELALSKLVSNEICPSCGSIHSDLATLAKRYLREHRCVLCGSENLEESSSVVEEIHQRLESLQVRQQGFEEIVKFCREKRESIKNGAVNLESRISGIRYKRTASVAPSLDPSGLSLDQLRKKRRDLVAEEAQAITQIDELQTKLESDLDAFRTNVEVRIEKFRRKYEEYATAFLGLECKLEEVEQKGLLDLKLFVPEFNEIVRKKPESCSEAQRFFLDIAFRLALIDSASVGENEGATFVCETPETALDLSYISNVVSMFSRFCRDGNNILLTANLQTEGIAAEIAVALPKRSRPKQILNLLKYGQLSSVQKKALPKFEKIIKSMLA